MAGAFDPKELKVLSDILALVLEEHEGQSTAALSALRQRARKNGTTGGALKNLFVAIAPNPPPRARSRSRTTKTDSDPDILAARQQIMTLTNDLRQLDLNLRNTRAQAESLRSELFLTQQSRAEIQQRLMERESRKPVINVLIWCGFAAGILLGIAGTQLVHSVFEAPHIDRSIYLH